MYGVRVLKVYLVQGDQFFDHQLIFLRMRKRLGSQPAFRNFFLFLFFNKTTTAFKMKVKSDILQTEAFS